MKFQKELIRGLDDRFRRILDVVKDRARELRRNGRRCCANQVSHVAAELESEFAVLELAKKEDPQVE